MAEPVVRLLASPNHNLDSSTKHFSVSSKWLYQEDSRFDANTYAKGGFAILDEIEACVHPKKLFGDLCGTIWHPVQNQARSNFKRIYTKPAFGVPFVSSRNMFFIPLRPDKFMSKKMPKLNDLMVPQDWLLISRSGTVGNVLYVNKTLAKCAITDHAIRIEPKGCPAGYLYALLASSVGQPLIAKETYGSTVDELEPKHIAKIPVPLPDPKVQKRIHDLIVQAYSMRDQANALFDQAEERLYQLLEIEPFAEDDIEYLGPQTAPKAFAVSSTDLGVRLDATHHVPTSRSAVHKLSKGKFKLIPLADRVDNVVVPPRFARIYVEKDYGIPFLQGSELPAMRIHDQKYISKTKTANISKWLIEEGWVLITRSGTIGRVAVVSANQSGWAASEHLLQIVPTAKKLHPGFLTCFLMTAYGQHQLKSKIYGGVVDELTATDTAAVQIPDVPFGKQEPIGEMILQAYKLRDDANILEDEALTMFEKVVKERTAPKKNKK